MDECADVICLFRVVIYFLSPKVDSAFRRIVGGGFDFKQDGFLNVGF